MTLSQEALEGLPTPAPTGHKQSLRYPDRKNLMARLRIRVELNRGGAGVPLHEFARVVEEAQKFFRMVADDIHIDQTKGEWLGIDFDPKSLNFTAEFAGPTTELQVRAFNSAFDGVTPLQRATIRQFSSISNAIGEDESIGFGLYLNDADDEPAEWRSLSRHEAARVSNGLPVPLSPGDLRQGVEADPASPLSADVVDAGAGSLSQRAEPALEASQTAEFARLEANLSTRIDRVEREIENHSAQIQGVLAQSSAAEDRMQNLLTAFDDFSERAARREDEMTRAALSAPLKRERWGRSAIAAGLAALLVSAAFWLWSSHVESRPSREVSPPATAASRPEPAAPAAAPTPPKPSVPHIDIEASESAWVSLTGANGTILLARLFNPGDRYSADLPASATLRVGNAGGLKVLLNGTPVGPLGPRGMVQDIHFKGDSYRVTEPVR